MNAAASTDRQGGSVTTYYSTTSSGTAFREQMLREKLHELGIDAEGIHQAVHQSIQAPTSGYDGRFGKSAIKAYRSFINSKAIAESETNTARVIAMAGRCAQQIDFLMKRHKSHLAEWVRHHDAVDSRSDDSLNPNDLRQRQKFPLILLLDNVRSAFNVGSLFRTADAAGCEQVLTAGITPHPLGSGAEKVHKSALGAERIVPSRHFTTTREAIRFLRDELPDYQIVGVETTALSVTYTERCYSKKGAVLVLGNEVTGVDMDLLQEMDAIVEIPMFGAKNSLNVAACAPVVLYEIIRQWSSADQ